MNLLVYSNEEIAPDGKVVIEGRRAFHIAEILKLVPGDSIKLGKENGLKGESQVIDVSSERVVINAPELSVTPPEPWFDMILAMPRPRVFGRVLQHLTSLGVRKLTLINGHKVEKSFFSSPLLETTSLQENTLLGLEQAGLTRRPVVTIEGPGFGLGNSLKSVSEAQTNRVCADPGGELFLMKQSEEFASKAQDGEIPLLAVGPEGGWVESELERFSCNGFTVISLGQRVLRVETAVIYLVALLEGPAKQFR